MHPEVFPGWPVHSYGLMLVVAFYSAYFLSRWTARKEGIDPNRMIDILLIAAVLGIVGSRALFLIQYRDQITGFFDLIAIWRGGLVFYGGLIAAVVGLLIYVRKKKLPTWRLADAAAPAIMIGLAFGRIGCFLNGCCWGAVCDAEFPLAVQFPKFVTSTTVEPRNIAGLDRGLGEAWIPVGMTGAPAWVNSRETLYEYLAGNPGAWRDVNVQWVWERHEEAGSPTHLDTIKGSFAFERQLIQYPPGHPDPKNGRSLRPEDNWSLPVHPTQLYSSFSGFLLCGILLLWRRWRRRPGEVFALMACLYAVSRFIVEGLRDDTNPVIGGLTLAQVTGIAVFAVGLAGFLFCRFRHAELDRRGSPP